MSKLTSRNHVRNGVQQPPDAQPRMGIVLRCTLSDGSIILVATDGDLEIEKVRRLASELGDAAAQQAVIAGTERALLMQGAGPVPAYPASIARRLAAALGARHGA